MMDLRQVGRCHVSAIRRLSERRFGRESLLALNGTSASCPYALRVFLSGDRIGTSVEIELLRGASVLTTHLRLQPGRAVQPLIGQHSNTLSEPLTQSAPANRPYVPHVQEDGTDDIGRTSQHDRGEHAEPIKREPDHDTTAPSRPL